MVKGKGSLAATALGLAGDYGRGGDEKMTVDFDLSRPEAAAAFEAFQASHELPDVLPAGVERVTGESVDVEGWSSTARAGIDSYSASSRMEDGIGFDGGHQFDLDRGTRTERHERALPGMARSTVSGETHGFEAQTVGT